MDQNHITKSLLEEQEITAAKTSLDMSVQRFEMAMSGLANRVESTAQSIQHAKDIATAPQRFYLNAKGTVQDLSSKAIKSVKENPKPFLIGVAGMVGFGVALYFILRKPAPVYQPMVNELDKQFHKALKTPLVRQATKKIMRYF